MCVLELHSPVYLNIDLIFIHFSVFLKYEIDIKSSQEYDVLIDHIDYCF